MSSQARRRVLIVDNDDDVLARLGKELTEAGYETVTTWSGMEALRLLSSCRFDSLLVDDYLPDVYIGEFLQRVSAMSICPIVFVMNSSKLSELSIAGSSRFRCVQKAGLSRILQVLAEADDDAGPPFWIH